MIVKRAFCLSVLLFSMLFVCGCETAVGAAQGIGSTVKGAERDVKNLWSFLQASDAWFKKNAW